MAGGIGLAVDLAAVPVRTPLRSDRLLYSESAGRFIVTVASERREAFESLFQGLPVACVGQVTASPVLNIRRGGEPVLELTVPALKKAWQSTFGDLI